MKLTPTERELLVYLLVRGPDIPPNISEDIDRHGYSVRRSGGDLEEDGLVRNKGRNVFALTDDGVMVARDLLDNGDWHFLND